MNKKTFWIKLSVYILFGLIVPLIFMFWRFKLFESVPSTTKLSGWGLIAILLIFFFFTKLINAVKKGMKYSQGLQVLNGLTKVTIPLILLAVCINFMKNLTNELFQLVVVLCFSETIAYIINPLPLWAIENNIEYNSEGFLNSLKKMINNDKK